jgi:hypothetical protein
MHQQHSNCAHTQTVNQSIISSWQNFYVIVGSAAGALTGLQFVVIALIAQTRTAGGMREIHAFGTPTVVHFSLALAIAATMTAPWFAWWGLVAALIVCGIFGFLFSLRAMKHARSSTLYQPDREDWIYYIALPLIAYGVLMIAAILDGIVFYWPLLIIAVVTLVLIFLGVRNAWDTVTYIAITHQEKQNASGDSFQSERPT